MSKFDWTKCSAVAEIVGAIAIVITLLYLATQTKQNTAAIAASVRQEMFANDQAILSKEMEFRSCQVEASNTWSSPECLEVNFLIFLRSRENNWLQYRDGVIDEVTYETYNKVLSRMLSDPQVAEIWPRLSRELSDAFVEYANQLRAEVANGGGETVGELGQ
jgi:hypothetical protein